MECIFSPPLVHWVTNEQSGKEYAVIPINTIDFQTHYSICRNYGAVLAEPRVAKENTFVASLIDCVGCFVVLGIKYNMNIGQWLWDSDQSLASWKNWAAWKGGVTEPDNEVAQNCAHLFNEDPKNVFGNGKGVWGDYKCLHSDDTPANVICERNAGDLIIFVSLKYRN